MTLGEKIGRCIVYVLVGSLVAVVILFLLAMISDARSQTMCAKRSTVVASLEKTYPEAPVSMGLASNGAVIEILASATGSFTIILTRPNGLSCVMAAGENWEDLPKRLKPSINLFKNPTGNFK